MNLKAEALWTNFLTSGIKLAEPETLRRVNFFNLFELTFMIVAPLLGLFYYHIGALSLSYACMLSAILAVGAMLALRATKNVILSANLAIAVLWLLLIIIRWSSGGISDQGLILLSWVWNAVLILMAIFLAGYFWGAIWSCMIFLECGVAVALFRSGYRYHNIVPSDIAPVYSLGFYLTGLLTIMLFAFLFEKERSEALLREKEKREMLTESRTYLESILDRLPVPTFVLDNDHRVVQWNRACQEITGISPEEILGKKVWEGFSLDENGSMADKILDNPDLLYEKYSESIVSMTESGSFSVQAALPKLKGGVQAIIKAAPILDQNGRVKGAIQTIQEYGPPPPEPQPQSTHLGGGIEDSIFPVFRIDSKGKISAWNKACERTFGYPQPKALGKSPLTFVSKPYRRNFREAVVRVLKGESFKGLEWKYYTLEGEPIYVLARVSPVSGSSGKIQECMVINVDITPVKMKMKKLARDVTEMRERCKKLSDEYNLLKSNVASLVRRKGAQ